MIRVLIVEDDPMARQLLEIYVEKSGSYTLAQSVESAAFAELCCRAQQVDLILMDVCTALNASGLEADESQAGCSFFINECMQHLPVLLKKGCTAIVCSHDLLAHSAMIHCAQMGYRVPEDISILGFDDIPLCRYTLPPLSTIRQNRTEIGKSAFFAMLNQLNEVHVSSLLLHPELIERASCASVAANK